MSTAASSSSSTPVHGDFPRRFGERHLLLKELGKGGMGQVFMALTGATGAERVCALKIVRDLSRDRDPEDLSARFLDEAKVVTKLSHENLVYVFDFGVVRGQGYLAMEFVQGKTLTELWNRCAAKGVGFPVGISLYVVSELVAGLGYAHELGDLRLVHRDVSPSNVMLSYTGGVKLIDFGLAKWKSKVAETATGINWGKVSYMSPEQYQGKPVDFRSDLFSAGLILWELLTGRQVFPGNDARARDPEIPPPSKLNAHLSPELDAAVMKALATDPNDRYASGREMSAALAAHLPRDAGKLALAEFLRGLFEADARAEAAERESLVAGAAAFRARAAAGGPETSASASDEDRDPVIGQQLADRYFVRRLIGEGAMGRVYEGHHTGIGKRVAIKIPRHGERRKNELLQRFRLEAQAASQIGHPNIADVTDCGHTPDGRFFFVMEFVDGIDLSRLVRREGPLPVERALLIAVQTCRALEAAHRAGIIHRDLKPSNVMLVRERGDAEEGDGDVVKVLDFGVAKFLRADAGGGDLTRTDAAVGTPKYMAPEQIEKGQDIDFRVDIYAVGGLLFFMLSGGHAPIEGDTVQNVWRRKVLEDPDPLSRWRADLPKNVEALTMRCLSRDPAGRPASMEELRKALLATIEGLRATGSSVMAMRHPSSTSLVGPGLKPRRRLTAGLLVTGTGTAIAIAIGMLALRADPRGPRGPSTTRNVTAPATTSPALVAPATAPPAPVTLGDDPLSPRPPVAASSTPSPAETGNPMPPPPARASSPPPPASAAPGPTAEAPTVAARVAGAPGRPGARVQPPTPGNPTADDQLEIARLLERAEIDFQEGRNVDAARLARRAAARGGGVEAWLMLGKIYRTTNEREQAVAAYEQALKLAPGNKRAQEGLRKAQVPPSAAEP